MSRWLLAALTVLTVALWSGASAQASNEPDEREPPGPEADLPPALVAVGVSGGFPSYQTIAVAVSMQSRFVGLQLKGSWTPVGPYFGVQLRGYPPIDLPVPVYAGLGAGVYGSNTSYHAALGAHVPLSLALRLDVEAGAASVPLLDGRRWVPHLALGLSYAFPVDVSAVGNGTAASRQSAEGPRGASGCAAPSAPDEGALMTAFERTLAEWLASARATYGSIYTDLDYSYRVGSATISGDEAVVEISYSGSVRAIGSGTVHHADGDAEARFRWTGCAWSNTAVTY